MRTVLLVVVLTAGCSRPVDHVSFLGVRYSWVTGQFPADQIDVQETAFVSKLALIGYDEGQVLKVMRGLDVDVYGGPIKCGNASPTGYCNGLQKGNVLLVRAINGCVYGSALTHEEAHRIREVVKGSADWEHLDPALWGYVADAGNGVCP